MSSSTFDRRLASVADAPPRQLWRAIREGARISRQELADELCVTPEAVWRWELPESDRNSRTPRGDLLDRYLRALVLMRRVGRSA